MQTAQLARPPANSVSDHASGFTLIELMLTVGLVALLAAIAMPSYTAYAERARVTQAVLDIRVMASAIQKYQNDNNALPATLAQVNLSDKIDPWGRPYVYYNIVANGKNGCRRDRALNPLNSDFDLYSVGRDGQTRKQITQKPSLDDVLRIGDNAYVGLASQY